MSGENINVMTDLHRRPLLRHHDRPPHRRNPSVSDQHRYGRFGAHCIDRRRYRCR